MKKTLISAAIVAAVAFTQAANAQGFNSSTVNANASARIITPIQITSPTGLNFGDVVPSASAGTVVLTPAGGRSATAGATLGSGTGVATAAFNVTGQASAAYTIVLPVSATISSGSNNMTVGTFLSSIGTTGALNVGGTQSFNVGATLSVGASQATGTYTGTFPVSVNYN
jgi:Domain of unknown function (DUF4402)